MAYEPLSGWVQVTRRTETNQLLSQRLHQDRACADASVAKAIRKGTKIGAPVTSYLSDKMLYAQARRLKSLVMCKCAGGPQRRHHITDSDRRPGEVQAGSQGTGRRR